MSASESGLMINGGYVKGSATAAVSAVKIFTGFERIASFNPLCKYKSLELNIKSTGLLLLKSKACKIG